MADLVKSKSGFLYKEPFGFAHAMWQKEPVTSDKVKVNPLNFELLPGDDVVRYLTETPAKEFVMQVHFTHQPLAYDNFAGVVVFADKDAYIECTTYRDQTTESGIIVNYYSYIKVLKKDYRYTFYGSMDGKTWIMVGSQLSRGSLIGFFMRCSNSSERLLRVDDILFTASNYVTIYGIKSFYTVELYDPANKLVYEKTLENGTTQLEIDTVNFVNPTTGYRMRILDPDDYVVYNEIVDLYGGDVYDFHAKPIAAFLDRTGNYPGMELNNSSNIEFDLGRIEGQYMIHTLTLIVPEGEPVWDVNLYIKPFIYNSHVAEFIELGLCDDIDDTEADITEWVKKVNIPKLTFDVPRKIIMRIHKDYTNVMMFDTTRYKFKVIIE